MTGVSYQSSPNFLNKSLLNLKSAISARLAIQQATGILLSTSQGRDYRCTLPCWEIQTQVLMLLALSALYH